MEEAARQRRERLAALKQNKFQKAPESDEPKQKVDDESAKTPERKRPKITAEPEITAAQDEEQEGKKFITAEEEAKKISEQLKDQVRQIQEAEVDILTLAPKKIDWDLKRDCESKLAKLERKTQRAVVELIRVRLQKQQNLTGNGLLEAVQHVNERAEDSD